MTIENQSNQNRINLASEPTTIGNKQVNTVVPEKISYAQALASSIAQPECIRILDIVGTEDEIEIVNRQFAADGEFSNMGITNINKKGMSNYTITCDTPENAIKVQQAILSKYQNIVIRPITLKNPQIKIVYVDTQITDYTTIANQILTQNSWIPSTELKIHTPSTCWQPSI